MFPSYQLTRGMVSFCLIQVKVGNTFNLSQSLGNPDSLCRGSGSRNNRDTVPYSFYSPWKRCEAHFLLYNHKCRSYYFTKGLHFTAWTKVTALACMYAGRKRTYLSMVPALILKYTLQNFSLSLLCLPVKPAAERQQLKIPFQASFCTCWCENVLILICSEPNTDPFSHRVNSQ